MVGTDFFTHLADDPAMSARFNASMRHGTMAAAAALPAAYDFAPFATVADLGGGDGTLLSAVLSTYPRLRGLLYDTPEGSAEATPILEAAGVADRCDVVTGDFFFSVPPGADVYLLKSVVHDWDDDRVLTILGHVRRVIPEHGRLLIVEPAMPERADASMPPLMYLSDLNMLVNVGGRERTEPEFRTLCRRAGFTVEAVTALPPPAAFSIIDAAPG